MMGAVNHGLNSKIIFENILFSSIQRDSVGAKHFNGDGFIDMISDVAVALESVDKRLIDNGTKLNADFKLRAFGEVLRANNTNLKAFKAIARGCHRRRWEYDT